MFRAMARQQLSRGRLVTHPPPGAMITNVKAMLAREDGIVRFSGRRNTIVPTKNSVCARTLMPWRCASANC